MSELKRVVLPEFGQAAQRPEIPADVYRRRMAEAAEAVGSMGLDLLLVYGDREHSANMAYLTGFDPRFEEAILLLGAGGKSLLLAGNECMGFLPDPALGIATECFQELSLMGQPRGDSRPLRNILAGFGIRAGTRVGCAGWKYFESALVEGGTQALELPAYLVDLLRNMTGEAACVSNAGALFMNPRDGLRIVAEPEQIAAFEYAAGCTSRGVLALQRNIREGVAENDLERFLDARGLPLSCHRMVSFGDKVRRGLSSASDNMARRGDPYTVAFGVQGALTCRAGCVGRGPRDLAPDRRSFYDAFVRNFFDVVAAWYARVRVGAKAGDVFAAVEATRDRALYDIAVNPGHFLHLDEWVHSPFSANSEVVLRSGQAIQMDIIPVSRGPFCCANVEDGIVLADEALRDELSERFPEMWLRMQARREFMIGVVGIKIDESVLPLGNMPAWFTPYALDPEQALVV